MDKQDKQQKIVAVFQSSASFLSGFYCASIDGQDRVDDFIESHYESGTFANLETFTDIAWLARQRERGVYSLSPFCFLCTHLCMKAYIN